MFNSKLKKTAISSFEASVGKYKRIAEKTRSELNADGSHIGYITDTNTTGGMTRLEIR